MNRDSYVKVMQDLLSRDPQRVREANRTLYAAAVIDSGRRPDPDRDKREADLALIDVSG